MGLDAAARAVDEEGGAGPKGETSCDAACRCLLAGDWDAAVDALSAAALVEGATPADPVRCVREQQFLEAVAAGDDATSLTLLQSVLKPLYPPGHERLSQLAACIFYPDQATLQARTGWASGEAGRRAATEAMCAYLGDAASARTDRLREIVAAGAAMLADAPEASEGGGNGPPLQLALGARRRAGTGPPCRRITTYTGHDGEVWAVAFSPNGDTVAAGCSSGTVYLWPTAGQPHAAVASAAHPPRASAPCRGIAGLAWSADGRRLLATPLGADPFVVSAADCRLLFSLEGHRGDVTAAVFVGSHAIVTAGADGLLKGWDSMGREQWSILPSSVVVDMCPADADRVFLLSEGDVSVLDTSTVSIDACVRTTTLGRAVAAGSSPDGAVLALSISGRGVALVDPRRGVVQRLLTGAKSEHFVLRPSVGGRRQEAAPYVACGGEDARVRVWRVRGEGKEADVVLEGHAGTVNATAWSPVAPLLATCSDDGTVMVWGPDA